MTVLLAQPPPKVAMRATRSQSSRSASVPFHIPVGSILSFVTSLGLSGVTLASCGRREETRSSRARELAGAPHIDVWPPTTRAIFTSLVSPGCAGPCRNRVARHTRWLPCWVHMQLVRRGGGVLGRHGMRSPRCVCLGTCPFGALSPGHYTYRALRVREEIYAGGPR